MDYYLITLLNIYIWYCFSFIYTTYMIHDNYFISKKATTKKSNKTNKCR